MALWTKKKLIGIVPAELEKVPLFVLLILQFNIWKIPNHFINNPALKSKSGLHLMVIVDSFNVIETQAG